MNNAEHITVNIEPNDKAFIRSDTVTIQIQIDGTERGVQKTIPKDYFVSEFDHLLDALRDAVLEAKQIDNPA